MMHEYIKMRVIKELMAEIACLTASDLELVGHNVIGLRENKKMHHHGINKDHKPVGHTVDSFAEDSSIIAEYSTEQGYFKPVSRAATGDVTAFPKAEKDLTHALDHINPDRVTKIYLVVNDEEPPAFRAQFNKCELVLKYSDKIIILDSRALAQEIYEQSREFPDAAGFYREFLPSLSQALDNYEYFGKLPAQCDGYVSEDEVVKVLDDQLQGATICVLHGVSGSGKTQAVIRYVREKAEHYENYIWITGDDWVAGKPLSAIQRTRGGVPINVSGLFNSSKTILVIDSLERNIDNAEFEELATGFDLGGRIVITSQSAILADEYCRNMPEMPLETAAEILGEDLQSCTKEALEFLKLCQFNPLILSISHGLIRKNLVPSMNLYREILSDPKLVEDRNGESVLENILKRLSESSISALKKIARSNILSHDILFLRHFIGGISAVNLRQLSILLPTSVPNVFKVHDLVCAALQEHVDGEEFIDALEKYMDEVKGEMGPSLLREIYLSIDLLEDLVVSRGDASPAWLRYAVLQVEGDVRVKVVEQFQALEITPDLPLPEVMCRIDAKEAHAYSIKHHNDRKKYYQECISQFSEVLEHSPDEDIRAELLHHKGKALRRCDIYDEALLCFKTLLESRPKWHATYGQIAHLGTHYKAPPDVKKEGAEAISFLFSEMKKDAYSVPLRVSLAAFSKLRSYRDLANEIADDESAVKNLADIIALSALEGFGQFYEAFVSFTSMFGFKYSSVCVDLALRMTEMLVLPVESVDRRQWVSACEALSNTATAADKSRHKTLAVKLQAASLKFADALSSKESMKAYEARAIAKAYCLAQAPEKALLAIDKVPEHQLNHWLLYRKTEAELAIGKYEDALVHALKALELAKSDEKAQSHIPTYRSILSKCYENCGDTGAAVGEMELAVEECKDERYKHELNERLSYLKRQNFL